MQKLLPILFLSVVISACSSQPQKTSEPEGQAPGVIDQEVLMTRNPATGEVESHKLWEYLLGQKHQMGVPVSHGKTRIYPNSWRNVDDFFASLAVQRLVYDPNETQTMYFCTGEGWNNAEAARGAGVWKSTNGGETWTQLTSTLTDTFWYCHDMAVHPVTSDVYVATRSGGLMRSKDGGSTWTSVLGASNGSIFNSTTDIEFTADNDLVVCIGNFNTDGIYFSETGDPNDWEKRMNGIPSETRRIELATAPSNANVMYAVPTSSVREDSNRIHGVYRTDDKGLNWDTLALPGGNRDMARLQGWYDLIIKVSPEDEDVVLVGGLNVFRTMDGGESWQQMFEGRRRVTSPLQYVHVDQHEVVFKNQDTLLLGNDGGVYRCDNILADTPYFYSINKNYNVTQFYSVSMDAKAGSQFVIGGTQDNGSLGSEQEGVTEFRQLSWADGSYCNVDHQDGNIFYTTTQYRRLYRTSYGDVDTITNPNIVNNNTLFINPIEMDPNDPNILYQLTNRGLWRLTNARTATEDDWEKGCRTFGSFSAIGLGTAQANVAFIGRAAGGPVYRIEDANTSDENYLPINCDPSRFLPDAYCRCVYVDPVDANHVLAVYSNYGIESVWESKNAMTDSPTWESHEGDLPDIPIRWIELHPYNKEVAYLATEAGVMMTTKLDGANTEWRLINEGFANLKVNMVRIRKSDMTIAAASHGRGIYMGKINDDYSVTWQERGPLNVGGRTRTLMFDPNDPTGKKLWAGSVSGGLWVAQDYDSINIYEEILPSEFSVRIGPNPKLVNDSLRLFIESDMKREVEISMYTMKGQFLADDVKTVSAGTTVVGLRGDCAEDALYLVRVKSGDFEKVFKVFTLW
ncbi:MAG: hypothetical protein JJ975_04785 [Bacteroidia bacterium]|nr:hypothetical protein [Bacteroidia bacterium]